MKDVLRLYMVPKFLEVMSGHHVGNVKEKPSTEGFSGRWMTKLKKSRSPACVASDPKVFLCTSRGLRL